jgi:adenine-specific DNA-methyltransferase
MILENLKVAGVQQAHKEDKITFHLPAPWPGDWSARKVAIAKGKPKSARPSSSARVRHRQRPDLVKRRPRGRRCRLRCADRLRLQLRRPCHGVQQARPHSRAQGRMNADLHMADDLKNTGKGNLFVIFGEPDIDDP